MTLLEFMNSDDKGDPTGYYDPARDKMNTRKLSDTRRGKLTLRAVNRLKKMRAMRELEQEKHADLLDLMYGQPDESDGGGFGGPGF